MNCSECNRIWDGRIWFLQVHYQKWVCTICFWKHAQAAVEDDKIGQEFATYHDGGTR